MENYIMDYAHRWWKIYNAIQHHDVHFPLLIGQPSMDAVVVSKP